MTVLTITWELLTAKQQALVLPLMRYAISYDEQVQGDTTHPLPDTTFADIWEAWKEVDRLLISDWTLSEEALVDITHSLEFLATEIPEDKVKEIVEYYS